MHQTSTTVPQAWASVFPGTVRHVRAVRAGLRALLAGCPLQDDAVLCGSEMAANAALHSRSALPGGQFTVRAELIACQHARIEVADGGGGWTEPARHPGRGRGLDIIASLATDWGIDGDERGRTVWARLDWPTPVIPAGLLTGMERAGPAEAYPADGGPAAHQRPTAHPAQQWTTLVDGAWLREIRRRKGLSQFDLAARAGLSTATVGRLERLGTAPCRTRTLSRLAGALGEHPAILIRATAQGSQSTGRH